jgi:glutamate synthase (NADPH/NADH) small chain
MEFLVSIQKKIFKESDTYIEVKDKKVLVIGGGDTAMDCVRTAIREGAKDVKCLYRRDEKNMPGSKKEYINAKEEGVEFIFNVSPNSIIANDNKATALVLDKTKLTTADENGRQKVQIVKNSSFTQEADIIIFALGFSQELPQFLQDSNLKLDSYDGIQTNKNHKTSNNNIYSGGDSVRGASLAVHAAADGRDSAIAMIKDFKSI